MPTKEKKNWSTVGAVALDQQGNVAAATSTGGMTNKRFGRIGDSPIIGAGTYANNRTCAVCCTGHGEPFMRAVAAYDLSCLMEYRQLGLHQAGSPSGAGKTGRPGCRRRLDRPGCSGALCHGVQLRGDVPWRLAGRKKKCKLAFTGTGKGRIILEFFR